MSKSISLHIIGAFAVAVIGFASIATSALAQDSSGYGGDSVHCTIDANPGVTADGATTLIWWSSENVTSATLEGVGEVEPRGWWWTNGIESATTYTMTVTTDDGDTATCEASVSLEEESVEHGFCSEVYPGREIADIDNNGWGDTLSGETGCLIDPVGGADETVECFDYDGDGWGWDGVQGCLIDASEETTDHGYCSDVYPGREIADIDGNGWGDTESGETGCRIALEGSVDVVVEEEEVVEVEETEELTHDFCSVTYPGRVFEDANGDGWGDTESDEAGCILDPTDAEEEVASHAYCSDVYPGREIADIDGNGWGDTESGEEGCLINPASSDVVTEETVTEEVATTVPTCTVTASPSTISADGSTTLSWSGDDTAVSSSVRPYGSTSAFFEGVDPTNEIFISGITDTRTYQVDVTDADGNVGTCTVEITVE